MRARAAGLRARPYGSPPARTLEAWRSLFPVEIRHVERALGVDEHREEQSALLRPEQRRRAEYVDQHATVLRRALGEVAKQNEPAVGFVPRKIAQAILERIPVAAEPSRKLERAGDTTQQLVFRRRALQRDVDDTQAAAAHDVEHDDVARRAVHAGTRGVFQALQKLAHSRILEKVR